MNLDFISESSVGPSRPGSPPVSVLHVHVVPRARRTELVGRHGDALKIRLAAPPVDGAANAELVRFLAARLGVPRAAVRILAGATGRRKRVRIEGTADAARILVPEAP